MPVNDLMRPRSTVVVLLAAIVFGAAADAQVTNLPVNKCLSGKIKGVAKSVAGRLGCFSNETKSGVANASCHQKTSDKFTGGADPSKGPFNKLENKYPMAGMTACLTFADQSDFEDRIRAYAATVPGVTGSTAGKCDAAKMKCVGKYVAAVAKCAAKAASMGGPIASDCSDKAAAKLMTCHDKAEFEDAIVRAGCTVSQHDALQASADQFIEDTLCPLAPGATGCIPVPTATASATATDAATPTATHTPTNSQTATPTATPANTATAPPSSTATQTPTNSQTTTPTATPTNTATATPTSTATRTPTHSPTSTPTATPTNTPTRTSTDTPTQTPTQTQPDAPPVVNDDLVITNQPAASGNDVIVIPDRALLFNDTDINGQAITIVSASAASDGSVSRTSNSVSFTEESTSASDGGTFIYTGTTTSPSGSDTALVTIDRTQISQSQLDGTSSGDVLLGSTSADTILGNAGNDLLLGMLGNDTLTGGANSDLFSLTDQLFVDTITDYNGASGDMIDLSTLFATATGGSNVGDYINYNTGTGTLSVDTNGTTGGANFVNIAILIGPPLASTVTLLYSDANGTLLSTTADQI